MIPVSMSTSGGSVGARQSVRHGRGRRRKQVRLGRSPHRRPKPDRPRGARREALPMKKVHQSLGLPYPEKMTLQQCLQLAKDAGLKASSSTTISTTDMSPKSGNERVCGHPQGWLTGWHRRSAPMLLPVLAYPLTQQRSPETPSALELAAKMTQAAHDLGTENLSSSGSRAHPWRTDYDPFPRRLRSPGRGRRLQNCACR